MPTISQIAPAQQTNVTGTGAVTVINASGLNFRYRDLVGLVITTANIVAGTLTVSDGKNTFVLNYPNAAGAPGVPLQMLFGPPVQQSGNGNAAWTMTASANASGYNVTAQFIER